VSPNYSERSLKEAERKERFENKFGKVEES